MLEPAEQSPTFGQMADGAKAFGEHLGEVKRSQRVEFPWYPYDSMANLPILKEIVPKESDSLFVPGRKIADIGAADGDVSFYLEQLGHSVDIYDYGPTNMNGLRGARYMKKLRKSAVNIYERDLDSQFEIGGEYDLILFLGILYHLKNPYYALEKLAQTSRHLFLSTRICRCFNAGGQDVSSVSAAYLLGPDESNNDATNFWIFTQVGLERILQRTGWSIINWRVVGDTARSNPQDNDHDERIFMFLRSNVLA